MNYIPALLTILSLSYIILHGIGLVEEAEEAEEEWREMASTLHFNKASALWKMSQSSSISSATPTSYDAETDIELFGDDLVLSDKLFELQRCQQSCLKALSHVPTHIKAFFRLVSVSYRIYYDYESNT